MTLLLSLIFGGIVGFSLGSLGGGGSILVVPALIYGLSVRPADAVVSGLAIVGLTSIYAAALHWRSGGVRASSAATFALTGSAGAYSGALVSHAVSDFVLLACLGVVMAIAGGLMLRSAKREKIAQDVSAPDQTSARLALVLVAGYAVGFLTGFLGVGGGFLIVPALTLVARIPIKQAIGTSLLVISLNCASGLYAHGVDALDWILIAPFLAASFTASAFAARFARRASSPQIKRLFACFILLAGCLTITSSVTSSADKPGDEPGDGPRLSVPD